MPLILCQHFSVRPEADWHMEITCEGSKAESSVSDTLVPLGKQVLVGEISVARVSHKDVVLGGYWLWISLNTQAHGSTQVLQSLDCNTACEQGTRGGKPGLSLQLIPGLHLQNSILRIKAAYFRALARLLIAFKWGPHETMQVIQSAARCLSVTHSGCVASKAVWFLTSELFSC